MAVFSSFIAAQLATALGSVITNAAVATAVANAIVGSGMLIAGQALARSRMPSSTSSRSDMQAVINQPAADRERGYGRAKLGGVRAFFDAKDGYLDQIIIVMHGEVSEFLEFYVGDVKVDRGSDGWVTTDPWGKNGATLIQILARRGLSPSLAYQEMIDTWGWTENHRLDGIATLFTRMESVKLEKFQKYYPEAHNTPFRVVCNLAPTFDPRTGRTEWSDNPALHALDYLTHPDGFRLPAEEMDQASFSRMAAICDQMVGRKDRSDERRYRHWGVYSLTADPKDVLAAILATCDAEVYETSEGKIAIRGGIWREPTVTITADHIISFDELQEGNDRFSAFNELQATYTDARRDYQPNDTPRWIDYADQAIRGRLPEKIEIPGSPSPTQSMRLMKIARYRDQPEWKGSITTTLAGLEARDERVIRLVLPELGIDGPFWVLSHSIDLSTMTCALEVSSADPAAYEWDPETEEGETSPPLVSRPMADLPVPAGLTLTVSRRQITTTVNAPVIVAVVDAPARLDLDLDAEYRLAPDEPWEAMTSTGLRAVSGAVADGEDYDVRARWRSARGGAGDWSANVTITITDD